MFNFRYSAIAMLLICLPCGAAQICHEVTFSGEVSGDQTYRRPIGMGLAFRMIEALDDHWGWTYEIGPTDPAEGAFDSYIYALNPPYRGRNITNLSIEYATLAQDAVAKEPLQFWFLVSQADGVAAGDALNDILWPRSSEASTLALAKLGTLKKGKGSLQVTDADFRPGSALPGEVSPDADYGAIYRIAFTVRLTVPTDFRLAPDLVAKEVSCPDPSEWRKQWMH